MNDCEIAAAPTLSRSWLGVLAVVLGMAGCSVPPKADQGDGWDGSSGQWVEIFRDEFDGPAGSAPNASHWNIEVRARNHNEELQNYTSRRENSFLDGAGHLVLQALKEAYQGSSYTSARLNSEGRFEPKYGRIEARIKLPRGTGLWPAFWMLGTSIKDVGWPACGEIDILELRGSRPESVSSAVHGPNYSGGLALTKTFTLESGTFADAFHVFTLEWTGEGLRWLVDERVFHVRSRADFASLGKVWLFDQPFFIVLNLAVGGVFDGNPDSSTAFPSQMIVDYVKVSELRP